MSFLNYLAYHRLYSLENVKRINKKLKPFLEPSADSTTKVLHNQEKIVKYQ